MFYQESYNSCFTRTMVRFQLDGTWTDDLTARPYLKIAFNENQNGYVIAEACWMQVVPVNSNFVCPVMHLPAASDYCRIEDVGVSKDGRWVVILLSLGDVLLWDLCA